jgi:hypothetical protein
LLIGEIRNAQAELGKRVDRRGLAGAKELEPATTLEQFTAGLRIAWRTDEQRPTHRRPYRRRKPIPQRVSMLDDLREQIGAWMVEEPGLPAIAILERLKSLHPDRFTDKHERTVQRAVKRDGAPNKRTGSLSKASPPLPKPSAVSGLAPPWLAPEGPQLLPAHRFARLVAVAARCAGPFYGLRGRPAPSPTWQVPVTSAGEAIAGSTSECRLTLVRMVIFDAQVMCR